MIEATCFLMTAASLILNLHLPPGCTDGLTEKFGNTVDPCDGIASGVLMGQSTSDPRHEKVSLREAIHGEGLCTQKNTSE